MTVKQKATKWLAHFALAMILVTSTVTTGSAEAGVTQALKVVTKLIKKAAEAAKGAVKKMPSIERGEELTEADVKRLAAYLSIKITCKLEQIQCMEIIKGDIERRQKERDRMSRNKYKSGVCKRQAADPKRPRKIKFRCPQG